MTEFTSLPQIYDFLEKHAQDYASSVEIGQLFNSLAKTFLDSKNRADSEKAGWETEFFFVSFFDGKSDSFSKRYDEKGKYSEYPNLKNTQERQLKYLRERLGSVKNPILKARYSHLLWSGPEKHAKYAECAVDNYLRLLKIYETKDKKFPLEHFGSDVLSCFNNAYHLSLSIKKYKLDKIKFELKRLLKKFNSESNFSPALRTRLIRLAIVEKKVFSNADLEGFEDICQEIANIWISRDNPRAAIDTYELGEKLEIRIIGKTTGTWREKIARTFESRMEENIQKEEYFSAIHFSMEAITNYRKIKNKEKVKEIEKQFQMIKHKVGFKEFSQMVKVNKQILLGRKYAETLLKRTPEEIIGFLASDNKKILPNVQHVRDHANELKKEFPLSHLFSRVLIDQQGNPAQIFVKEDERDYHDLLSRYRIELELGNRFIIQEILIAGIREKKLNTYEVVQFLKKHSWAGKDITKRLPNNQEITKNWISLLAPAIDEYFLQLQLFFLNSSITPNFVLCIDSLSLKIEGMLRDFCELNDVQITDIKQDGIAREKNIYDFLHEEKITKMFSEDELIFLKFLLIEQMGYNLRHRVAHSLMNFQEYGADYANYLFIGILRLCKYDIVQSE